MPLYDIRLSCLTSGGRFSWNFNGNVDNTTTPAQGSLCLYGVGLAKETTH